jgi:hypothetical protein
MPELSDMHVRRVKEARGVLQELFDDLRRDDEITEDERAALISRVLDPLDDLTEERGGKYVPSSQSWWKFGGSATAKPGRSRTTTDKLNPPACRTFA